METLTSVRTWCDCCDMERAEYATEQLTKTGTFSATVYTQRLCLACLRDKVAKVGKRDISGSLDLWGMRYRPLIGNAWTTEGVF